jgi:hypothetical protein
MPARPVQPVRDEVLQFIEDVMTPPKSQSTATSPFSPSPFAPREPERDRSSLAVVVSNQKRKRSHTVDTDRLFAFELGRVMTVVVSHPSKGDITYDRIKLVRRYDGLTAGFDVNGRIVSLPIPGYRFKEFR